MTDAGRIAGLLVEIFRHGPAAVAFERACRVCVEVLSVSGAAISVTADADLWQTLSASDTTAARLEELQFTLGLGPGREAYVVGGPVLVADLTDPDVGAAWPMFAGQAVELGVRAVFAFPLQLGAIRPGVLALYRDLPGALPQGVVSEALLAADLLCLALLGRLTGQEAGREAVAGNGHAGVDLWADSVALGHAEVHQAVGMVMSRLGVSAEVALARLRGFAFSHSLSLAEVAAGVVARRIVLDQN
jgi:ANTAR domain